MKQKKNKEKKTEDQSQSQFYWEVSGAEEDNPRGDRPYQVLKKKRKDRDD